jgi:hypothetical protein
MDEMTVPSVSVADWKRGHRATLFGLLDAVLLRSTSQDSRLEEALRFLQSHSGRTGEWLRTTRTERAGPGHTYEVPLLDLNWVPDSWWRLLTDDSRHDRFPDRVHRRHFEACVFSQLMWELKAGDLCIVGSDAFADYRQLGDIPGTGGRLWRNRRPAGGRPSFRRTSA